MWVQVAYTLLANVRRCVTRIHLCIIQLPLLAFQLFLQVSLYSTNKVEHTHIHIILYMYICIHAWFIFFIIVQFQKMQYFINAFRPCVCKVPWNGTYIAILATHLRTYSSYPHSYVRMLNLVYWLHTTSWTHTHESDNSMIHMLLLRYLYTYTAKYV